MSKVLATLESARFNLFDMTTVETEREPYYVLWKDGEVHSRGSLELIQRAIRGSRNSLDSSVPRDWEPPGYENV